MRSRVESFIQKRADYNNNNDYDDVVVDILQHPMFSTYAQQSDKLNEQQDNDQIIKFILNGECDVALVVGKTPFDLFRRPSENPSKSGQQMALLPVKNSKNFVFPFGNRPIKMLTPR